MASNASERDTARPRFYKEPVQNMGLSEKEGRPIYEDREMIEIKIPGDKLFTFVGFIEDKHKQRWPEIYAAFKRGEERATSGTPLEHWPNPGMTKSRVLEFKAQNVLSVEELAGVPDNALPRLGMGARDLREQARAYIAAAKGGAENAKMAAEIAQLRAMVENMSGNAAPQSEPPKEKTLEDCTDAELKEFIKRETGEAPRGNISRDSLMSRAAAVAENAKAEAA